jgi:hypothetical protein
MRPRVVFQNPLWLFLAALLCAASAQMPPEIGIGRVTRGHRQQAAKEDGSKRQVGAAQQWEYSLYLRRDYRSQL